MINFSTDIEKQRLAMADSILLFGEAVPYTKEKRLNGDYYIFPSKFTNDIMEAFTTGCMSRMSEQEQNFTMLFVEWQQWLEDNSYTAGSEEDRQNSSVEITKERGALEALNNWVVDELACNPHPEMNSCFDTVYTYTNNCE